MKKAILVLMAVLSLAAFQANAAVLLTDDFSGGAGAVDSAKYPLTGGTLGDVKQVGGELVLKAGSEWQPRLGLIDTLPDNVKIETEVRVVNPGVKTGTWEANFGLRASCASFDGNGLSAGAFTADGGAATPDKIKLRRGGDWYIYASQNLSADITAGQSVILELIVNKGANSGSFTIKDKTSATVLATATTADLSGIPAGGYFMIEAYNIVEVAYNYVKVYADGGAGAVIFEDDFNGPNIDPSKWLNYPSIVSFAAKDGNGYCRLNGDDPNNGAGDFAYLPTKSTFDNFDLQAVFKLTDLKDTNLNVRSSGAFAVRVREVGIAEGYYQFIVWPNPGNMNINGTSVNSPAMALRYADSSTTFTYVAGPVALPITPAEGDTFVVNMQVNGTSFKAYSGASKIAAVWPVISGTNATLSSGVVQFDSFGIVGIDLDEYTIWDYGTGSLAPEPAPPASAKNWSLYE